MAPGFSAFWRDLSPVEQKGGRGLISGIISAPGAGPGQSLVFPVPAPPSKTPGSSPPLPPSFHAAASCLLLIDYDVLEEAGETEISERRLTVTLMHFLFRLFGALELCCRLLF